MSWGPSALFPQQLADTTRIPDYTGINDLSGTVTGPCQSERSQRHTDWTMSEWNISAAHWLDHVRVKDLSGTLTGLCQSERSQEHTDPCQSERSQEHTNPCQSERSQEHINSCQSERSQEYAGLVTLQRDVSVARRLEEGWRTWNLLMVTSIVTMHVKRFCTITHMTFEYDVWVQVCAANVSVHEHVIVACKCGIPIWWI